MKITLSTLVVMLLASFSATESMAQRGGDRGGDRGGGDRGGDRGGFSRGGPPSGGFGGFSRGGPSGGFSRGGSSEGSSRGGFDPAAILGRFDRNGNGMIEPEEAQGPAQFFLQRMAQNNPKIDLSKPVPISLLSGEISRMRGESGGSSSSSSSRGGSTASNEIEPLVPGFASDLIPEPLPGFGATADAYSVRVEERDLSEADERLRRYDTNKDGKLDAGELRQGRWSDDPMSYDRNRDGMLTKSELAVRYAKRRIAEEERRDNSDDSRSRGSDRGSSGWGRSGGSGWSRGDGKEEEKPSRFGDAKSYRVDISADIAGMPEFFGQRDANGDGQVLMSEYSSSWNAETLNEFMKWDVNGDGIIEPRECLAVVKFGDEMTSSSSSSSKSGSSGNLNLGGANIDWAKRQIGRYDKDGNGKLTVDEWENMLIKPTGADFDGDGAITVEEYAKYRSEK